MITYWLTLGNHLVLGWWEKGLGSEASELKVHLARLAGEDSSADKVLRLEEVVMRTMD
jgi:hypothetical protein